MELSKEQMEKVIEELELHYIKVLMMIRFNNNHQFI